MGTALQVQFTQLNAAFDEFAFGLVDVCSGDVQPGAVDKMVPFILQFEDRSHQSFLLGDYRLVLDHPANGLIKEAQTTVEGFGYEKFMRTEMWGVSYFYALEENPGRDGYHVHALWCDCLNKSRREVWRTWFDRYGRARIEPVNSRDDVADYCAKYVTKEGSWWNVKLVGSRHPDLADFKLTGG